MKLLKFEIKKNWRRKKFMVLFLIIMLSVSGLFFRNTLMQDKIGENLITNSNIQEIHDLLNEAKAEIQNTPKDSSLQSRYETLVNIEVAIQDLQNAIKSKDWKSYPKREYAFLKILNSYLESGGQFHSYDPEKLKRNIERDKLLIKEHLAYEDENYSLAAANFTRIAATFTLGFFGVLLFVFFLGDQLSEEMENQTIRTLYTQPLQKWRILGSKYASMLISVIWSILILLLGCFVVPLIFNGGRGSFSYPQLIIHANGFYYITTGKYILELLLLFFGSVCFAFSLVLLLSTIFKNRFSMLLVSLMVLSGGYFITYQAETLQTVYNPFFYLNYTKLIERPDTLGNFANIWVPFTYSFVTIMLCCFLLGKEHFIKLESPSRRPFSKGRITAASKGFSALLLFEWRKSWRQGYLNKTVLILLISFIVGYVFLSFQTGHKEEEFIGSMKTDIAAREKFKITSSKYIEEQQNIINQLKKKGSNLTKEEQASLDLAKSKISGRQTGLKLEKMLLKKQKDALAAYQKRDWQAFYKYWIYDNQLWNGEIKLENTGYIRSLSFFTYSASIKEKEILAKQNLKPAFPSDKLSTIYDKGYFNSKLDWAEFKNEQKKVDNTGLFYLNIFYQNFLYVVPWGILLFLLGMGLTAEQGKKRTLHFLMTQPIARTGVLLAKYVHPILLSIGIGIGLIAFMLLIGTVGNRFGDWTFPVLHYDTADMTKAKHYSGYIAQEGSYHFIKMGDYLLQTSLLFLVGLLFLIIIAVFLSIFIRNHIISIITTLILALGGYFVSTTILSSSIAHLSPFTYLNIGKITNGELAAILNNSSIEPWTGFWIILGSSVLLFGIGLVSFKKETNKWPKKSIKSELGRNTHLKEMH